MEKTFKKKENFVAERIYVSNSKGFIYGEIEINERLIVDVANCIERDLSKYKVVSRNNVFTIYDKKKTAI